MNKIWIEQDIIKAKLADFFHERKRELYRFGRSVNQTFETFVFAAVAKYYAERGWEVRLINPQSNGSDQRRMRLKYSTRGRPDNYSYFVCSKSGDEIQIRHQLRVATHSFQEFGNQKYAANVCLDVAVINSQDLSKFKSDDFVNNSSLIAFGEAKHMSAFAELIANFIGLVHEMMPSKVRENSLNVEDNHLHPFLYVSGLLYPTARGLKYTIENRKLNIDIFDLENPMLKKWKLPF